MEYKSLKRTFLVTGASGFIGSHLISKLTKLGHSVRAFEGDITKTVDWGKNLKGGETIYLVAGVRTETEKDFEINAKSLEVLFDVLLKGHIHIPKKLILSSSQAVYMGVTPPFKEDQKPNPTTTYGKSKLMGEKIAQKLCHKYGTNLVILRYSTVLGSGVREKSKMSGPLFIWTKAALLNEPIKVFQDGNQTRDYISVDDVVSANILATNLPDGIYNVGGGKGIKVKDVANWIKSDASSQSEIIIMGGKATNSDPSRMFSDTSKLKSFGWKKTKTARSAVSQFVQSIKS